MNNLLAILFTVWIISEIVGYILVAILVLVAGIIYSFSHEEEEAEERD